MAIILSNFNRFSFFLSGRYPGKFAVNWFICFISKLVRNMELQSSPGFLAYPVLLYRQTHIGASLYKSCSVFDKISTDNAKK